MKNNHVKIGDFGLIYQGTNGYMSPEMTNSNGIPITSKTDIW